MYDMYHNTIMTHYDTLWPKKTNFWTNTFTKFHQNPIHSYRAVGVNSRTNWQREREPRSEGQISEERLWPWISINTLIESWFKLGFFFICLYRWSKIYNEKGRIEHLDESSHLYIHNYIVFCHFTSFRHSIYVAFILWSYHQSFI